MLTIFATRPRPASGALLALQRQIQPGDYASTNLNGIAETTFISGQTTIAANTLQAGQSITIRAHLTFTHTALGPTLRPRIRLGAATLVDAGNVGLLDGVPNARAYLDATLNVRSVGTAGRIEAAAMFTFTNMTDGRAVALLAGPSGEGGESGNPVTVNTTVDQTLGLSVQYSSNAAGNNCVLRQMRVSTDYPLG